MLIQALCRYCDMLDKAGKLVEDGYSRVRVHYRIWLSPGGAVEGMEDWMQTVTTQTKQGKEKSTKVPREATLFRRLETTTVAANYVDHRPVYIFGLEWDQKAGAFVQSAKAQKSHQAFTEKNLAFIEGIDSPIVNAYRNFLHTWEPAAQAENPYLTGIGARYSLCGYVFALASNPGEMLQDDPQLNTRWNDMPAEEAADEEKVVGQCAVTGKTGEIAKLHDKITGVRGAQASGAKLVSAKNDSGWSYGLTQSQTSSISVAAMQKYTKALNYLVSSPSKASVLGDITLLRFAMDADPRYDALGKAALMGEDFDEEDDDTLGAADTEQLLQHIYSDARAGVVNTEYLLREQQIDPGVDYYIVGLKPNQSRLAVQFVYRRRFGELIASAAQHQADLAIGQEAKPVALWQVTGQLVSPKTKETVHPSITAKLLDAVINGRPYPEFLLATVIRRIRTDRDTEKDKFIQLNPTRAGILKAWLNREARRKGQKEEIGMALNKENENAAYLCGRLFAMLEKIQQEANPGLNRTITDAYFASACARPALIFPRLIKLAQTHLKKLEYAGWWNRQLGEITSMLKDEFPDTLSLADQGRFDLGYYQQKYAPSAKKQNSTAQEAQ
jgi:CRISPR-associated protein Csd1